MRELMLEGVLGIAEGLNPKLIRIKLEAYAPAGRPRRRPRNSPGCRQPVGQPAEAAAGD